MQTNIIEKKYVCSECKTHLIKTREHHVCPFCGVVSSKFIYTDDFQNETTFAQKQSYDTSNLDGHNLTKYNKYVYPLREYILSVSDFELLEEAEVNKIINKCMNIIYKLSSQEMFVFPVKNEPLVCALLTVVLEEDGILSSDILFIFHPYKPNFPTKVSNLVQIITEMLPEVIKIDTMREKFVQRTLNKLDIPFKIQKVITTLFNEAINKVWFNGTHYKIILSLCIVHVLKDHCGLYNKKEIFDLENITDSLLLDFEIKRATLNTFLEKFKNLHICS